MVHESVPTATCYTFGEPPASRIFNQLLVDRVLSLRKHGFYSTVCVQALRLPLTYSSGALGAWEIKTDKITMSVRS